MKRTALALAAMTAATIALAQTTPPTTAEPRTSTTPREQTAPPADSSSRSPMSEADKQTLMMNCMKTVQADNPNASEKDVKAYCNKAVKSYSAPR